MTDGLDGVRAALDAAGRAGSLGAWIVPPDPDSVLRGAAAALEQHGTTGPLAATVLAVKDNIDVAGMATTAAHPAWARVPTRSAPAVQHLLDAGAVVAGKTNLDQFATGLVGTRSPFGACRNPFVEDRIAGGSSSGSAIAVATGAADVALATDTAGSGRVPAALCGLVGLKPTRGLVSTVGVVPAIPGLDCVSVLARTMGLAAAAVDAATRPDGDDPWSRTPPPSTSVVGARLRVGIPRRGDAVAGMDPPAVAAWSAAVDRLHALGDVIEVDMVAYLDAGTLLYGGAFVAARWPSFGQFLVDHPDGADPTVGMIVSAARDLRAHALATDVGRLRTLASRWAAVWQEVDVVAVPTVAGAPTINEVSADPIGVNALMGRWTTATNLLDLCAAAVPCGWRDDGVPFGVSFLAPAFADPVAAAAGARLLGEPDPPPPSWTGWSTIVVVGAHLTGQPLNHELTARGARLVRAVTIAPDYRLYALPTDPPKPGLVRVAPGARPGSTGTAIAAELWVMPLAGFGDLVRRVPPPLVIGSVELSDRTRHPGFLCEPIAIASAPDISGYGGWLAYQATTTR